MVPKFDHAPYSGGRGFGTLLDAGNNDILKILQSVDLKVNLISAKSGMMF
jgi:hypothetical protein